MITRNDGASNGGAADDDANPNVVANPNAFKPSRDDDPSLGHVPGPGHRRGLTSPRLRRSTSSCVVIAGLAPWSRRGWGQGLAKSGAGVRHAQLHQKKHLQKIQK